MQSANRSPLRSLQNELLGLQHSHGNQRWARIAVRGEMTRCKSEPRPVCARRSPAAVILPDDMEHMKENVADLEMAECSSGVLCSMEIVKKENEKQPDGERKKTGASLDERFDHVSSDAVPIADEDAVGQQCGDGVGHITLKSFVCTGADIEITNASRLSEETVLPLPEDQVGRSFVFCGNESNAVEDLEGSVPQSSCRHKDHAYCLEKESSILGNELPGSETSCISMGSDTNAENMVQVGCQNIPELFYESLKDTDADEHSCAPVDQEVSGESDLTVRDEHQQPELSRITDQSLPHVILTLVASPVLNSSLWQSVEDDAVGLTAGSSTPFVGKKLQVDGGPMFPRDLQEDGAAQAGAGTSSDSGLSILHSQEGSEDPFTHSSPKILHSALSRSACLREQTQNPAQPQDEFLGRVPAGGIALPGQHEECTPAALEKHNSLLGGRMSCLWTENLESPMPPPRLNSTALNLELSQPAVQEAAVGVPADPFPGRTVPLQQQLLQMADLLIRTSGNLCVGAAPAECHSVGTWTSPVRLIEQSVNTSGIFERKREFSVAEASTSTDSLLWNLSPGSLASASRQELEQRLTSTLIMVEALSQQLSCIRAQNQSRGPGPSELREKFIQTDHTELNQVVMYKELYIKALEKIRALELDQEALKNLLHGMQDVKAAVVAASTETEDALTRLNEIAHVASDEHDDVCKQMVQMRALYGRCREALRRTGEKASGCLQEREQMRQRMEEALQAKAAAFDVTEQLRARCAFRIAALEQNLGSHLEVKEALTKSYLEQASLNKEYVDSLQAANELLESSICSQNSLQEELCQARRLLQRAGPIVQRMWERTATALGEAETRGMERDQAVAEKIRMEVELARMVSDFQEANQQIGDLNLQMAIRNSEMSVLRQRLNEAEEERDGLRMKNTEMSASVSSIQASYAFLQQALADETHKSQQASEEVREATECIHSLEADLGQSQDQIKALGQALAERDQQLEELQRQAEGHVQQLRHHQETKMQLGTAREMNEFLQAENELSREQVAETEGLLRSHLQGLRERNLECEDLKQALTHLQRERDSIQEELDSTQERARRMLLGMGEQLVQASVEVALLHHRVRGLTTSLQGALSDGKTDGAPKDQSAAMPRRVGTSFLDTVMDAISADEMPHCETAAAGGSMQEEMGSRSSAFTRISPTTPKKEEEEDQNNVLELLSGLGEAMSELGASAGQLRELQDAKQAELQQTVACLQRELQALSHNHECEVSDLKEQNSRLQAQVDHNAVALQQRAQDEKALKQLCVEMDQSQELLNMHRAENTELRREVSGLQLSLQRTQLEAQTLREELAKASGQSAPNLEGLNEKILLRSEVERLKNCLAESEDSRFKLVERAKRHRLVHETNQRKVERELQLLDEMIETVRKTLSSVPAVVQGCQELQRLAEYLG
ncbi:sperm-associated antigen 5 isoform X2 [Paramormyrops kingsleyae]|uniref:sperm-associated antigen 5 isoform X2 n=1 Tax=Paramormyrops kingsleyae TaxID=1676925 RepID=UPI000CD5DE5F|nr:sperm-associated antigen 5 isoform X2 [Paramormyrops kingsleyae]